MLAKIAAATGFVMLLGLAWTGALALSPGGKSAEEPGDEALVAKTEPLANAFGSDRLTSEFFIDYVHSVIAKRD